MGHLLCSRNYSEGQGRSSEKDSALILRDPTFVRCIFYLNIYPNYCPYCAFPFLIYLPSSGQDKKV